MVRRLAKKAVSLGIDTLYGITPQPLARDYRHALGLFGIKSDIRHDIAIPDREEFAGAQLVLSVMDLTPFTRKQPAAEAVKPKRLQEFLAEKPDRVFGTIWLFAK